MINFFKNKKFPIIISLLIIFFIISIFSVYSSTLILNKTYVDLPIKQLIRYIIGFVIMIIILNIKNKRILDFAYIIYIINIALLILVLFIGEEVNNARSWFNIPLFGSFQPSEFMKIGLILVIAKVINNFHYIENKTMKVEMILILKVFALTMLPVLLTFIQPDTGSTIFFILIGIFALFISGIRLKWFVALFTMVALLVLGFFILYFEFKDSFVNIFGYSLFYRVHRILDWTSSSGMQLENSLIVIGSSGLTGHGLFKTPIYFPEPYTDFIFTVFVSSTGLIGGIFLILIFLLFDYLIINEAIRTEKLINKLLISGILICIIYAQIQNISMTLGILPITGIPLPFISYGGSSIITYFILIAITLNIIKENKA